MRDKLLEYIAARIEMHKQYCNEEIMPSIAALALARIGELIEIEAFIKLMENEK